MFSSIETSAAEVITGFILSCSIISKLTRNGTLVLFSKSVAVISKLYENFIEMSGFAINTTLPVFSFMLNALASIPPIV